MAAFRSRSISLPHTAQRNTRTCKISGTPLYRQNLRKRPLTHRGLCKPPCYIALRREALHLGALVHQMGGVFTT